ncbi:hypothetical protein DSO57_1006650 [Entomophthora muscae]|uniref:Uncharacterized protein n=1 Tax=Entomophthora muscae TaxID=34485 RepID=A0ACC2U5U4_9FUNG|nr:hypothetical protein DSO57_1006650 [Entomophthora muscae]
MACWQDYNKVLSHKIASLEAKLPEALSQESNAWIRHSDTDPQSHPCFVPPHFPLLLIVVGTLITLIIFAHSLQFPYPLSSDTASIWNPTNYPSLDDVEEFIDFRPQKSDFDQCYNTVVVESTPESPITELHPELPSNFLLDLDKSISQPANVMILKKFDLVVMEWDEPSIDSPSNHLTPCMANPVPTPNEIPMKVFTFGSPAFQQQPMDVHHTPREWFDPEWVAANYGRLVKPGKGQAGIFTSPLTNKKVRLPLKVNSNSASIPIKKLLQNTTVVMPNLICHQISSIEHISETTI